MNNTANKPYRYSVLAHKKDNNSVREFYSKSNRDEAIKIADSCIPMLVKEEVVVYHGEPADYLSIVDNKTKETIWVSLDYMDAYK